jgi:hypothetical protein
MHLGHQDPTREDMVQAQDERPSDHNILRTRALSKLAAVSATPHR